MRLIGQLSSRIASAALYMPFMIGQYTTGAMLFTTPVDFTPPPRSIVRSPANLAGALSVGAAFVWCTLAALTGTPLGDPATRALLSCRMFQSPGAAPLDVPLAATVEFAFGVTKLQSLRQRPPPPDEGRNQGPSAPINDHHLVVISSDEGRNQHALSRNQRPSPRRDQQ